MNSERLIEYLRNITLTIFEKVAASDLLDDAALIEALRQIDEILNQFGLTAQEVMPQELILTYFSGVEQANALLAQAGMPSAAGKVFTDAGKVAKPFQKVIHLNAVERIVEDSMNDLQAAIRTAKASASTTINGTLAAVREDIATGIITGNPRKVTQRRVMESFLKDGMTSFYTVDNRSLPLDFYAQTVVRTKIRTAAIAGSTDRYKDAGADLVIIMGNGDSCDVCSQYNGMTLSLTGKIEGYPVVGENGIRLPPYHPNCRCGCRPFLLISATPAEIDEGLQRNAMYQPGKDMRTAAQKRNYEREQKLRRKANAEKKQFMRWQSRLGAEAPKTLGAFRRMKRQNTVKFQELQSEYRSRSMTKNE